MSGDALINAALPSSTPTQPERLPARQLRLPSEITSESQIEPITTSLELDAAIFSENGTVLIDVLVAIVLSPAPSPLIDAMSSIASVYAAHPTDFVITALNLVLGGLTPSDVVKLALGESRFEDFSHNLNLISASPTISPKKTPDDAPYSVDENTLRSAIYIPLEFTYGKIPPFLVIPGTGATAGETLRPTLGSCLQARIMQILCTLTSQVTKWQICKLVSPPSCLSTLI